MAQTIDVVTAVREIVNTTRKRTAKDPTAFPFFFIVGAGISAPMIPVASRIEAMCRETAERDGLGVPELSDDPMERYERMLTLVNPNAADRQEFLHELINNAPISPANLRLAHVLESRSLTNIVVTPNFDEMLTKALRLFGVDCVVCDHPKTTQRINPNRADLLQIVHVHGTHWFYDCFNLKGEIAARANLDDADNVSMADLLNRILADRSPIVVGYSGWTSDVIMTALFRWLRQPVRMHNLYWFCHRASEAERVPEWLRNHGSVRIVAEDEPIEASAVFQAINTANAAKAPAITSDPLAFFATHLEATLGNRQDEKDIYLIAQVIARVRRGSELEAADRQQMSDEGRRTGDAVALMSDAVRRAAYDDVLKLIGQIDVEALTIDQCVEVDAALATFSDAQRMRIPDRVLQACPLWQAAAERVLAAAPEDTTRQGGVVNALFVEAYCVGAQSPAKELDLLDKLLDRFGHLQIRFIAMAMGNRANRLDDQNRTEESKIARRILRERFGSDPEMKTSLDHSRLNELLGVSSPEVLSFAQDIATKYTGRNDPASRRLRGFAVRVAAWELAGLRRYKEAFAAVDDFLKNHVDDGRPEETISILLSRARALVGTKQGAAAMASLKEAEKLIPANAGPSNAWLREEARKLRKRLTAKPKSSS